MHFTIFFKFWFFQLLFWNCFFNKAPSEGFSDEAEPVYANTYINTHTYIYMLRVSLWWTFMRFPYNIVQLQFDVDILIYIKKKHWIECCYPLIPIHAWPKEGQNIGILVNGHSMKWLHVTTVLFLKNKSWHFFISQLSNYEHVDGCCHVVANRESDDEITHYSFRQNSMLEVHALFAALSMTAARCFNQMLLCRR